MSTPGSDAKAFAAHLRRLDACGEAYRWARGKSGAVVWRTCQRGDWLLWLAGNAVVDRKALVLAACACARLSLVHVKPGEDRPRRAIETAERWARGDAFVSFTDVRAAAAASASASAASASADAAAAAYASAAAAYAAAAAAAAYVAASAAAYVAAARTKTLAECAALVRKAIPWSAVRDALAAQTKETT